MATVQEKISMLMAKKEKAKQGGGEKRIEKQHASGKMTARERIAKLFDAAINQICCKILGIFIPSNNL